MRRTRRSVSRQRRRLLESGGEWKKPSIWSWCSPTIDRFNSSLFIFGEKPHEINLQPSRPKLVSKGEWADYHSLGLDAYVCCCSPVLGAFQIQRALGRPSKVRPLSYLSLLFFSRFDFHFYFLISIFIFWFLLYFKFGQPLPWSRHVAHILFCNINQVKILDFGGAQGPHTILCT